MTMYNNKLYEERREWLIKKGRIKDPGKYEKMMDVFQYAYYTILEILIKKHWQNHEGILYNITFSPACFFEDSHRNNRAMTLIIPAGSHNIFKGFKISRDIDFEDYIQGLQFFAEYYNLEFKVVKPNFQTSDRIKTYQIILR